MQIEYLLGLQDKHLAVIYEIYNPIRTFTEISFFCLYL